MLHWVVTCCYSPLLCISSIVFVDWDEGEGAHVGVSEGACFNKGKGMHVGEGKGAHIGKGEGKGMWHVGKGKSVHVCIGEGEVHAMVRVSGCILE